MRIKLIASIVTTAMLLLCGCKSGIDNENSHIQMSNAAQQIEQKTESNNKEENAIIDDGVYRTYSLGETFPAGAILDLNSSLLLRTAETPVKTAIYYNGELYKTIRFLYKGIIINHNKKPSQPTLKRRFFKKKAAFFSWPGLGKEWC